MSKTFMVRKIGLQLLGVKMEKVMMTFYKIVIRMKIMSLINFPLVIHLAMTAVILVSFCTLILKRGDQNELTLLFISTKILQHYLVTVFCISDESVSKIGTATAQSQRNRTKYSWKSIDNNEFPRTVPQWQGSFPESQSVLPPVEYFRKFFDDSLTAHIVYQSNL